MQSQWIKKHTKPLIFILIGLVAALLIAFTAVSVTQSGDNALSGPSASQMTGSDSAAGQFTSGQSAANQSTSGQSTSGQSASGQSGSDSATGAFTSAEDKGAAAAHEGTPGEDFVEAEAIVTFNSDISAEDQAEFDRLLDEYGASATTISHGAFDNTGETKTVTAKSEEAISELIDALAQSDAVAHIQRNYIYRLMVDESESYRSMVEESGLYRLMMADSERQIIDTSSLKAFEVNDSRVKNAQQNNVLNDYTSTQGMAGANVARAWSLSRCAEQAAGDSSVTVAVLDTGCDVTHEDLKDNIDTQHMGMINEEDTAITAGTCKDISGHGTHVAGIVGASTNNEVGVAGVSYNATVLPINIFSNKTQENGQPTSNTEYMIAAFTYLENLIQNGELTDLRVINMSLGSTETEDKDQNLRQQIKRFADVYNVIAVCAGGNGTNAGPTKTGAMYPGDYEEAFSVTWLGQDGTSYWRADYNEAKDISAPGTSIMSTMDKTQSRTGHQSYGTMQGSSMATPVVSGVAALLWAKYPDLTVAQVREAMQVTAHKVSNQPASSGSAGAVDAAAAIVYAGTKFAGATFDGPAAKLETSLNGARVTVAEPQTYTGEPLEPKVTVEVAGKTLTLNRDYTVAYDNNKNAGTAHVTVTGKGNYTDTASGTWYIAPRSLEGASVSFAGQSLAYTGQPLTPAPTVRIDDRTLVANTDYTVTGYSHNVNTGETASVTITGRGNYTGSVTGHFTVGKPARTVEDGIYTIRSQRNTNMGLDITSGSLANSANVQLYALNSTPAQSFRFTYNESDGYYTITNIRSGKALDVKAGKAANSTNVQQYTPNGTAAQRWMVERHSDGSSTYYVLRSKLGHSWVLDITSGRIANKSNIQIYTDNGTAAQRFVIEDAQPQQTLSGTHVVQSRINKGFVLDVRGGSFASSANVQLYEDNGSGAQQFSFEYDSNTGYYLIKNVRSGHVLDIAGGKMKNGTNIWQYKANGTWAQKWIVEKDTDNSGTTYYTIRSALDPSFVVDVSAGKARNSQNVQLYKTNNTNAQRFTVR